MNIYPEKSSENQGGKSIGSWIFGNRFHKDQTLYEYLIEFLLIFCARKDGMSEQNEGKMHFHGEADKIHYYVKPRMGLKRFIFFDKARKNNNMEIDEIAYSQMMELLTASIEGDFTGEKKKEVVEALQDLFHGYAVVLKKRSWCAQAMMPICPEVIFCEAMPNEKARKREVQKGNTDMQTTDMGFSFTQRNFLARGGELYYLHLNQFLDEHEPERKELERLLTRFLQEEKQLSNIADWIQQRWEKENDMDSTKLEVKLTLSYIPAESYCHIAGDSVEELISFLSCKMDHVKKIELFANGLMFQVMRMMSEAVGVKLHKKRKTWIVDMRGENNDTVKKLAAESLKNVENDFVEALYQMGEELAETDSSLDDKEIMKRVKKDKQESYDVFKAKGKELQCIVPMNGAMERFSLSENMIRFLVLALIRPQDKMTLDMFLNKLYEHYGIVIGPEEFRRCIKEGEAFDNSLSSSFDNNMEAFQEFLKATGFLRELSDATSIVVNPYVGIVMEE